VGFCILDSRLCFCHRVNWVQMCANSQISLQDRCLEMRLKRFSVTVGVWCHADVAQFVMMLFIIGF
jgi:hypothetical protein